MSYIVWILVAALYAPVFFTLYSFRWDKVDYTHAYFILPISLWLTWRKRARLRELFQKTKSGKNLFGLFTLFFWNINVYLWLASGLFIHFNTFAGAAFIRHDKPSLRNKHSKGSIFSNFISFASGASTFWHFRQHYPAYALWYINCY